MKESFECTYVGWFINGTHQQNFFMVSTFVNILHELSCLSTHLSYYIVQLPKPDCFIKSSLIYLFHHHLRNTKRQTFICGL